MSPSGAEVVARDGREPDPSAGAAGSVRVSMLVALVATTVALGAVEVFLRLANLQVTEWAYNWRKYGQLVTYDAAGGFTRHIPNGGGKAFGADMRFNSHGMRDHEHAFAKPPGTHRVLLLGDSITLGLGERVDETYPRRLEALLNGNAAVERPVEVICGAAGGWNTEAERNYLRAEGLRFAPDVVVLLYVTNDNELTL